MDKPGDNQFNKLVSRGEIAHRTSLGFQDRRKGMRFAECVYSFLYALWQSLLISEKSDKVDKAAQLSQFTFVSNQ